MLTRNSRVKYRGLVLATLAVVLLNACGGGELNAGSQPVVIDYSKHKALVIGVDGMQYEKLLEAVANGRAPNIASFGIAKSYIGGVAGSVTEQATYSGPGWTTILTGGWVNRHKVTSNDSKLRSQAESIFQLVKNADVRRRTASIVSWDTINDNFARDIALGYIDRAEKCSEDDQCVADKVSGALRFGDFDFIFAHFDEPDLTGHEVGFTPAYQAAIETVDAQVGQLLTALQQRQQDHADEDWLVIVTPDHGRALPDGHNHGNQTLSEKTTFIAINKAANAQFSAPFSDPADKGFNGLYGNATQADIVPSVMAHMGIRRNPDSYRIDGVPLIGELGVRQLTAQADKQARSVTLQWRVSSAPSGKPLTIYRDGKQIAQLSDSVNEYTDSDLQGFEDEVVDINYSVVLNQVPVAYLARADLGRPTPLSPALLDGLAHLHLMENDLLDRRAGPPIAPWENGVAASFGSDGLGGLALYSDSAISGYRLEDTVLSASPQFSIGFWFRSGGQQSDTPILANKDYANGKFSGIAIAQWGNSIRFNFGDGIARADLDGLGFTPDQWVYLALAVDGASRTAQVYVGDSVRGLQQGSVNLAGLDVGKLAGLRRFGLNEDATGSYFSRGYGDKGKMDFNDLAIWNRVLTKKEIAGLFSSGQSLASLNP
ncbi:concanavalin A-like lectin/glucanase superfamily protein [Collimonas sp. PA-H2]|nr:concanavalin A-like lectin/glucanase superfamily protein [Collimonas sp. PA-H2]